MVRAVPLSKEAFAPFGDVIGLALEGGNEANQGTALRYDWLCALESSRPAAMPNLAVFRSTPKALPFSVKLLERHPCSTQLFVALKADRYLVVVAPDAPGGEPDVSHLRAFVCRAGQGINYKRGVWHHPVIALDAPAELLMLAWEDRTPRDCEERWLAAPIEVSE